MEKIVGLSNDIPCPILSGAYHQAVGCVSSVEPQAAQNVSLMTMLPGEPEF
jgi:hypothetical protein